MLRLLSSLAQCRQHTEPSDSMAIRRPACRYFAWGASPTKDLPLSWYLGWMTVVERSCIYLVALEQSLMNRCRPFGCLHRGTKRLTQALHNTVASACVRDDTVEVQDSGPMLFATGGAVAFPAAYTTASTAPRSMPSGLMQAQESHLVCAFYCVHVSAGIVHARLYVFPSRFARKAASPVECIIRGPRSAKARFHRGSTLMGFAYEHRSVQVA